MDAVASMREVQSTLQTLFSATRNTTASTSASAAGFADALADVTATEPTASASIPVTGTASGPEVVTAALKYVGVPYVFGGEDASGMDCSGLVQRAFADLGVEIPRLVRDQEKLGTEVPSLAEAKPGDLIVTAGGDHISIYLGNNTVVHAPYAGRDVSVQKLWVGEDGIKTIRRVIPESSPLSASLASLAGGSTTTASALAGLVGGTNTTGTSDLTTAALQAAQAAYARSTL
jgi:cell wall-associated NlpC family hydrolase